MSTADKQIPKPTELDLEFFQSSRDAGALCIQQCQNCSDFHHPPRLYCPQCFSGDYVFPAVSGKGTVYSHTVSHFTTEKAWADAVPYATIVVELDEGPRVVGSARGIDPAALKIGLRVKVVTEAITEDFVYLWVEHGEEGAA